MKKFLTKIIGASLAIAMMIGAGAGVSANKPAKEVNAATIGTHLVQVTSLTSGNQYVIVGNNNGYALPTNPTVSSGKVAGTAIANVPNDATGYLWTFTASGNFWLIGDGTKNIYHSNGGNSGTNLAYDTGTTYKWKLDYSTNSQNHWTFTGVDNSTVKSRGMLCNGTNFGGYALSNETSYKYMNIYEVAGGASGTYYTVTFNSNGGTAVAERHVDDDNNTPVAEPTSPTKTGYKFVGWYNEALTEAYNFDNPVTGNITLYAKWDKADPTANYAPSNLTSGTGYRVIGQVTAKTGSSDFFIQDGSSAMKINNGDLAGQVAVGDVVDLFGTYTLSNTNESKIGSLLYSEITETGQALQQVALTDIEYATVENANRYFEFTRVQLNSGFSSRKASIKNSSAVLYYNAINFVDNNSQEAFDPNDYHTNDYLTIKGVVIRYNATIQLLITYIDKMAQYTVTFDSNVDEGVIVSQTSSQSVLVGDVAEEPNNPTRESDENNDYTFGGWYTTPACMGDSYNFSTPITGPLTLYAKWNPTPIPASTVVSNKSTEASLTYHYSKSGNGKVDTLNNDTTGITGQNYTDWTNEEYSSGVFYKGKSAGSNSSIQLRIKNSEEGVVSYHNANDFDAKKVTVQFESHTSDGNSVQIYGKNTAYNSAADLFNDQNKGTLLGTIACGDATNFINITGSYKYIGIRSTSGAVYLNSVDIQWGELPTYNYSNVGIRFTGTISTALWDRLNSESTILGYGIMYATAQWCDNASIEDWYGIARVDETNVDDTFTAVQNKSYKMVKGTEIKSFYTPLSAQKPNPAQVGDVYGWSLFKNIAEEELATPYTGVAYIRTENDEIIFLNEITKSVANLAQDLIDADNEYNATSLDGSLKDLADKA